MTKPEFIEKIEEQTKRNFSMTHVPVLTIKEFKEFCKSECGDVYAVGLIQLLKIKKQYEELLPLLSSLQSQVNELRSHITQKTERRRTFGDE